MTVLDDPEVLTQSVHANPLVSALDRGIDPVRTSPLYLLGMVAVMLAMMLLVGVYLGLIALVGYGVFLHFTENTFILGGRGKVAALRFFVYVLPGIVGGILVLFMVKPLASRRRVIHAPLEVSEKEQPILHAYVRRLADIVGAPRPKAIHIDCQVNASASFDRGFLGFLTGNLVLTIGLPLAAGLDVRGFTGVLAHEFGHFAQGGGMRMTYIIRTISAWFGRVVYERDSWDDGLHNQMHHGEHVGIQIVAAVACAMVWVTRQILKGLMYLGIAVSSFMLRQMEFDADRYEARVAGSDAFAVTCGKLQALNVAAQASYDELDAAWKERRLCDNLPVLIRGREAELSPETRLAISKHSQSQNKAGWFDTHPPDVQRIASAAREASAGIIGVDAPASELFTNFDDLACRATVAFYQLCLGDQVQQKHLVGTDDMVSDRTKRKQGYATVGRYFQGTLQPLCPAFPSRPEPIADHSGAAELLFDLRSQFVAIAAEAKAAIAKFNETDDRIAVLHRARAIVNAGCRIKPADFKLASAGDISKELNRITADRDAAAQVLRDALTIGMQRLELALALGAQPAAAAPAESDDRGEYSLGDATEAPGDARFAALAALRSAFPYVDAVRLHYFELTAVLAQLQPQNNSEHLIQAVLSLSRKAVGKLAEIQSALGTTAYPYEHREGTTTIARFAVRELPSPEAVGAVASSIEYALDALISLYMRLMSDLTLEAEAQETEIGLSPSAEPEPAVG